MRNCASDCYELARTLSTQGFTVAVRTTADRPARGLGFTCLGCQTRYDLRSTPVTTAAQHSVATLLLSVAA